MGILDMIASKNLKTDQMRMEPFVAPDLSGSTDRELLEMMTLSMFRTQHTIEQILISAQSNPLMASLLPKP